MKAIVCAQFNPKKTMKEIITDRNVYRLLILAELAFVWCS
jgi:hypothetical protein